MRASEHDMKALDGGLFYTKNYTISLQTRMFARFAIPELGIFHNYVYHAGNTY